MAWAIQNVWNCFSCALQPATAATECTVVIAGQFTGMSSDVLQMRDPGSGRLIQTAWVRELHATGNILYAGTYSLCKIPGHPSLCVKVVFPLPNGSAMVIMKPESHPDGALSLVSAGKAFGDPGFYFVVHAGNGLAWTRYLRALQETIKVYAAERGTVRADHDLRIWDKQFLRLHYRMRATAGQDVAPSLGRLRP